MMVRWRRVALVTYWWDQRDGGALLDPRKARLADGIDKAAAIDVRCLRRKSDAIADGADKKAQWQDLDKWR